MRRAQAVYRTLLHGYPAPFRHVYGQQMCLMFAEQLSEASGRALRIRAMAVKPAFTAVAIVSLALGIGANTTIFSVWNGVLYAPLPSVDRPEGLAY